MTPTNGDEHNGKRMQLENNYFRRMIATKPCSKKISLTRRRPMRPEQDDHHSRHGNLSFIKSLVKQRSGNEAADLAVVIKGDFAGSHQLFPQSLTRPLNP